VGTLLRRFAGAVKDSYVRKRPKKARNWPHKKKDKPPGQPVVRNAATSEVKRAQRLRMQMASA
jgi:hypothetical protein